MTPKKMRRGRRAARVIAAIGLALATGHGARAAPPPPAAAAHDTGTWDLAFEKGNRRCRLFLRSEPHADGFALAIPAGCHKAFPALAAVVGWLPSANEHVLFKTEAGATVLDFGPNALPNLTATTGDGDSFTLTPINPALQDTLRVATAQPVAAPPPAVPAAPGQGGDGILVERTGSRSKAAGGHAAPPEQALPPTTLLAVAGNYAVLRDTRDTGCMVTLETVDREAGRQKARLAPSCRDQGITIFDPVGWTLLRGSELVLTAKKGHTTALTRRDDKTWMNAPPHGPALALKRL